MSDIHAKEEPGTEVKPEGASDQINVRVLNQQNQETFFKIKKTTKLGKLMETYCQRNGLKRENVRFKYDGQGINENSTPSDIELEDGGIIDVFLAQTGGSF
ncbi:hypothetical protein DICPUDRAFT_25145 [Dictyostelium purpureum]|uniref:Ubiquitin-like domain-containing protein n=1 Tax=Dictyostelium purpureum TaxID=5786 RepID=F0Z6I7_DICPU|nr:uncharacterized protein DICPUDRAFT_25145 [Dictyostelium purpureum]EGC40497.1 hypothetical protein DICPUDRAFT_25145 [Dictyostelium purpureum]|eukprot:XP_003283044.1 hypothetical protein DICPUDRAFT_25145 [Dictyostelium purpureum]